MIVFAWSQHQTGRGSPWVTATDRTDNTIVWVAGTTQQGDQRLHGYDGDTGAEIYAGGGANELMGTRQWNTGMVARGRIYFGADNKIYAFKLPTGLLRLLPYRPGRARPRFQDRHHSRSMWNGFGERTMRLPGTIFVRDKTDNRVTLELPIGLP